MLFVAGCTSGTSSGKKNGYELTGSFNGGNDALSFSFEGGMPPEKIKDNAIGTFDIRVLVQNMGEFDIPKDNIHAVLTGFDLEQYGVTESTKTVPTDLRGFKKQGDNIIEGGKQFISFNSLQFKDSIVSGTRQETLAVNICYPYETRAIAVMCVSGNTLLGYDNVYEACEIEGEKQYANSGGPVRIENLKQYSAGESKLLIQFDIVHDAASDYGSVYESGSLDNSCKVQGNSVGSIGARNYQNKVKYVIETGLANTNCESTGTNTNTVMLADTDTYTVSCEVDTTNQGDAYEKLATITLNYDYVDRISKDITVEHIQK